MLNKEMSIKAICKTNHKSSCFNVNFPSLLLLIFYLNMHKLANLTRYLSKNSQSCSNLEIAVLGNDIKLNTKFGLKT